VDVEERMDIEDILMVDPSTLDPSLHYRFVQERPRNLARRKIQGYEPVLRTESGVKLIYEEEGKGSADDLIRVGDTILMACPKDRYKARRSQLAKLTRLRLGSAEDQFKSRAQKKGVRTLTADEGES
jgi:hypothetical protein